MGLIQPLRGIFIWLEFLSLKVIIRDLPKWHSETHYHRHLYLIRIHLHGIDGLTRALGQTYNN